MSSPPSPPPIAEVMKAADSLAPFPEVIWKVMPLLKNMAPVNEIEAVIKYDQVITAKVLALCQSSLYTRKNIASLRDAIVFLGQDQLVQVIMTACSARYFSGAAAGYDLREGELWEHSVGSALMTEIVGQRLKKGNLLTAYTAGLLHDIGKTVLHHYVNTYFDSILSLVQKKRMRFLDAEREIIGIDHQQLGILIAQRWRLPREVVTAIGYHHSPLEAPDNREVVALVYVANRMVSAMGIGCGADGFLQPNQDEVFSNLGITRRMVEEFLAELIGALQQAKRFLSP